MRQILTLAILVGAGCAAAGNALVNGGFEQGLEGWENDGAAVASAEHAGGERGCVVRLASAGWSGVHQSVPVPAGYSRAKVSGWLRADSVRGGKENWERGRLSIEFRDAAGQRVGDHRPAVGQVRGRMPWARVERIYDVPAGSAALRLECALGNSTGSLYCDELAVEFEP